MNVLKPIKTLIKLAGDCYNAEEALAYTQAALNIANTVAVMEAVTQSQEAQEED